MIDLEKLISEDVSNEEELNGKESPTENDIAFANELYDFFEDLIMGECDDYEEEDEEKCND